MQAMAAQRCAAAAHTVAALSTGAAAARPHAAAIAAFARTRSGLLFASRSQRTTKEALFHTYALHTPIRRAAPHATTHARPSPAALSSQRSSVFGSARRHLSSSSSSGRSSNDSELVAWSGAGEVVQQPTSAFLPVGQLPKTKNLLLLPSIRPVFPGLSFDIDLRLYPASTRAALLDSVASAQPYVALVMLQPSAGDAVVELARKASSNWTREERVREGLDSEENMQPRSAQGAADMFDEEGLARLLSGSGGKSSASESKGNEPRVPLFPVVTGLSQLHSIGVAAEIRIVVKDNVPRLHGVAHRRIQLLGVESDEPAAASAAPDVAAEAASLHALPADPPVEKTEDAAAAAAPSAEAAPQDTAADAEAAPTDASTAVVAAETTSASAVATTVEPAAPLQAIPAGISAMRVRVKHLEESYGVHEQASAAAAAAAADGADPAAALAAAAAAREADVQIAAYVKEINQTVADLATEEHVSARMKRIAYITRNMPGGSTHPARVADIAAYISCATGPQLQQVLEILDVKERLAQTLWLWKHEAETVRLRKAVAKSVKEKFDAYHAKLMLKEQKKVLDDMLSKANREARAKADAEADANGTPRTPRPPPLGNDRESVRQRFTDRVAKGSGKVVPEQAMKVIEEELAKLASLEPDASEYALTRNYLDWLTSLPWGVHTAERFDLDLAEEVLNREHYGLEDVKTRILQFIAVGMLLNQVPPGKILCLVGPPGVGKTSIGKSIAEALQRKFYRFSVGGLEDVSEIKGHRRTYVGALPGKLVQALKRVQASNPVILIDEIDKLGRGHRGDPAAALLEVLDPEQNNAFTDHYLDVPVDLSKVLFIATANDRSRIPGPLADRMDFIELSGYVMQEKLHIAENHLLPSIRAKVGLSEEQIKLEPEALLHLIRWYCREAGVRGLQKQLEKIHRKVALTIARAAAVEEEEAAAAVAAAKSKEDESAAVSGVKEAELVESSPASSSTANPAPAVTAPLLSPASLQLPIVINVASLSQYVGKPVHSSDRMYETNPVGVATGLGTNSIGGSLLYIECTTADQALTLPEDAVRVPSAASAPTTTPKKKGSGASSAPPAPQRLGRGELFCTGQLGDVIKESSSIAYTVAKRLVAKYTHALSPHRAFFEQHRIHLHMPEGATPKDGPSAGIAMVTALLSLALNCAPLHAHAMTGELTLTGKVLGIGGVKEKLMAAKHAGIRTVILPLDNQKDVVELKPYVIEGLDIHYAAEFDDVFQRIFPHFVDHVEPPFADHARIGMDALTATNDKKQKKTKTNKRATNDSNAPATSGPSILPLQQPTAETKQPNAS